MTSTLPPRITGGKRVMDADGIRKAPIAHITEAKQIMFVSIKTLQQLNGPARDVNRKIRLAQARTPIKTVNADGS
jgi:hypothetical protein